MVIKQIQYPVKQREHWHHLLDSTFWNDFIYREGDIIINAYIKSGTTWVQQIVGQLLWNGAEGISVSQLSPWVDCRFPTREERLEYVERQTHRRFLKSHIPADTLVFSPLARYIYIGRDGRDVLWSQYNHHCIMKDDVIQSIDAVPERIGPPIGKPPQSVITYFREWLARDGYPWWPYWEHIRSWWQVRRLSNVLLVHFADLKRDMPGEIRRLAGFLEIDFDTTQWGAILDHCSFEYMKSRPELMVPFGGTIFRGDGDSFLHKGVNGRWIDLLTSDDIERYECAAERELGSDCAHWLATGEMPEE